MPFRMRSGTSRRASVPTAGIVAWSRCSSRPGSPPVATEHLNAGFGHGPRSARKPGPAIDAPSVRERVPADTGRCLVRGLGERKNQGVGPTEPPAANPDADTHTALVLATPAAGHLCRLAAQFPRERVDAPVAHITVMTPFLPEPELDPDVHRALVDIAATTPSFSCTLGSCQNFDNGWYYLAPDDPAPFNDLSAAIMARFSSLTPYDGSVADVVPHMSIGVERVAERRAQLMDSVERQLPIEVDVDEMLLVRSGPQDWVTLARFPLQGAGARG